MLLLICKDSKFSSYYNGYYSNELLGGQIGKIFANFFANRRQMPIGAHINLPIGANFGLA
jgi:hypothetical protein